MYIIFRQDNRQKNPNPESPVYLTCITLDHRTKPKCPERTLCRHTENTQILHSEASAGKQIQTLGLLAVRKQCWGTASLNVLRKKSIRNIFFCDTGYRSSSPKKRLNRNLRTSTKACQKLTLPLTVTGHRPSKWNTRLFLMPMNYSQSPSIIPWTGLEFQRRDRLPIERSLHVK